MPSDVVINSNEEAAKLANSYARDFILEGSTQLINNTYDIFKKRSLHKALRDIRKAAVNTSFSVEVDYYLENFYQSVKSSKKYSIGNCHELALLALDYIVNYAPHVNAEVYNIHGGDHVFLVIGRERSSHPTQPETWGKNAYICDPWSDKVYPASEYLTQTKNFYFREDLLSGERSNCIEDFNSKKHKLSPITNSNTTYIRSANSQRHLLSINEQYNCKQQEILAATVKLQEELLKITRKINRKHGPDDEKLAVIVSKIDQLNSIVEEVKAETPHSPSNKVGYLVFRETLENKLKDKVKTIAKVTNLTHEEKTKVCKYRNEKSISARLMRFFKVPPETNRLINKAVHKNNELLADIKRNKF